MALNLHPKTRAIIFTTIAGGLLLVVIILGAVILHRSKVANDWVAHSYRVRLQLDAVMRSAVDAESSQRGFLLTDDRAYLDAYRSALARFEAASTQLGTMVADNPLQGARVDAIRALVAARHALLDDVIGERLRAAPGARGAALNLRLAAAERAMAGLRQTADEMTREEERLLRMRLALRETFEHVAISVIAIAIALLGAMGAGLIRIQRDLERRERLEARLVQQKSDRERLILALARSNHELDQFAYVASHDLQAPLRGISNLSAWIEEDLEGRMTDESRRMMKQLRGRVARLDSLVDGILAYARAGQKAETTQLVDVGKLVREVVELLSAREQATITIDEPMPRLEAEVIPLQQVFQNLIGNAVKHGRKEHTSIEVTARDEGPCWLFSVKDDGPGIAPEHQGRVWGVFQTLESRERTGGNGIGLAIVKKIVESRGGRVWIESELGRGATFRVAWPKPRPQPASLSQENA